MTGAIWILLATVAMGVILYTHHRITAHNKGVETESSEPILPEDACCGQHIVCEKESLFSGVNADIVYYDDEELDEYKSILPNEYTDKQIEQFRDVLYTLRPEDVAGWGRSIQLREIQLPDVIKDELLLLISENRKD